MNAEMGESLCVSWLKHVKKCQIVQLNWHPSCVWDSSRFPRVERIIREIDGELKVFSGSKRKNSEINIQQILDSVECDAVGVAFGTDGEKPHFYGIESAFHSDGLHYNDSDRKVVQKLIKIIVSLYLNTGSRNVSVGFVTPVIKEARLKGLVTRIDDVQHFFQRKEIRELLECEITVYTEGIEKIRRSPNCLRSLRYEILRPLIRFIPFSADSSELFMRALLLRENGLCHKLPKRSCLRSAVRALGSHWEGILSDGGVEPSQSLRPCERTAINRYAEWLKTLG